MVGNKVKEQFWDSILHRLSLHEKERIIRPDFKPSAVIFPIFSRNQEIFILFTQRTNLVDNHKGQISFPGGRFQDGDTSLKDTALREGEEEIGVKSKDLIVIGELDDVETMVSNFVISPFVVAMPYPYKFRINEREVEKIIELPLNALLDCRNFHKDNNNGLVPPYFKVMDKVIWGATARILINFLDITYSERWNCSHSPG